MVKYAIDSLIISKFISLFLLLFSPTNIIKFLNMQNERIEIDINKVINKKDKGKVSVSVTQIKE